jgi:hypothetical protein
MPDQDWHEFIQNDPGSTFPPNLSSIQVMFASGRLVKGTWRDGMLLHFYTSTRFLNLRSRAGDTSRTANLPMLSPAD